MPLFGGPNVDRLKARRDVPELTKVLGQQRDWHVRKAAADALGQLGDAGAIGPLIAALRDEEVEVRWSAAQALGQIRDARAVEPLLVVAIRDPLLSVRSAAADAIVVIGEPAAKPLIASLPGWVAAEILGRLGDRRATKPLINTLPILAAIVALGRLGDARAVKPLIDILQGEDQMDRAAAARALGQIGDPRAVESLVAVLGDQNHDEFGSWREATAEALGQIGDRRAVEPLIAALNDQDQGEPVRKAAAKALDHLGIPRDQWRMANGPLPDAPLSGSN